MTAFIPKYEALAVHRLMLRDEVRIETFQRAIKDNVSAGDVVIDYGAGTGILSVFAVQAGASRVYAIERTGIIDIARQVAEANQVEDRIIFIPEPAETAELPEKADVLVSEWLG
ncbi:MAG: 50S ribosomal protein L11 methyltransferase, partial [Candidatus Latescibacteria bacterium]|nr:50S ribosomal protein L11 methyltransferase [Candidatus Latescibacterota bacterium]